MKLLAFSVLATCLTAGVTYAAEPTATLDVLQGKALINTGTGFTTAQSGQIVHSHDRVVLLEDATAVLASAETGCVVMMREPGVYAVPDLHDCVAGQAKVLSSSFKIEPANGVYVPAPPPPEAFIAASGSSFGPVAAGLGFAAVAGVVAAYTSLSESNVDTPVSSF